MSIIVVFGGAVIIEGIANCAIRLVKQVKIQYDIARQRAEWKRRRNRSQRRWA